LLCGEDDSRKLFVQTIEIFNGRMSMLACVGYVVQEFVTGKQSINHYLVITIVVYNPPPLA